MFALLAVVFLVFPIVEIYVMLQVSHVIGVPETILLLIGISFVGGVGIVVIAIMLDRITRAMAKQDGGGGPRIFSRRKGSGTGAPEGEA